VTFRARTTVALAVAIFLLSVAGAAAISVRVSRSGWAWGNPTPQGNSLTAIDFLAGRGYAVGASGTALRTDDGGLTWSGLATGTSANLNRLQIIDPNTVVVLGADGCVLRRTNDGGQTFQKIFIVAEANCPDKVQSFFFVDRNTGYLVLRDGSVLRTADGGQSFSKQTALPGTPASATGGNANAADLVFTDSNTGIAFINPPGAGSLAFATTDGGVSWKPIPALPPGSSIGELYLFDANTIYGVGPNTLLRSADGGKTFTKQPVGSGLNLTAIRCADASTCLLTDDKGALHRTTDAGLTATTITAASVPLAGAAFASPMRAVAVGAAGQTVVSSDGGVNYSPVGGGIGGNFLGLRLGPSALSAFAPGSKGQIAFTLDDGVTWRAVSVPTSSDIIDTSWTNATTGFALDARGGLFRTANGGASWQTLSPGAATPANAVLALADNNTVLLIGPTGARRAVAGGPFTAVSRGPVANATLDAARVAGGAVVAWGVGTRNLLISTDKGSTWGSIKLPDTKRTRIRQVSFVTGSVGYLIDTTGRLWATANAGRRWRELISAGTAATTAMAFGSATSGFLTVAGFGGDTSNGYVLHTTDAGMSWVPQAISRGAVVGLAAPDALHGYALLAPTPGQAQRQFFFTGSGGSAGAASTLKLRAAPARFSRRSLKKAHGIVTISGALSGALGGEQIAVSARALNGGGWATQVVTAGVNGGSFSARFRIRGSEAFVAQWAGDSGRAGAASHALIVKLR
jgi:photosystem II stability/assembly factor-like uncharacterized protein